MSDQRPKTQDSDLIKQINSALDQENEQLDELTLARLQAARLKALEAAKPSHHWAWRPSLATVAASLLVITLWVGWPASEPSSMLFEDLEMLSTNDTLEFYEDLEFYQWLESQEAEAVAG